MLLLRAHDFVEWSYRHSFAYCTFEVFQSHAFSLGHDLFVAKYCFEFQLYLFLISIITIWSYRLQLKRNIFLRCLCVYAFLPRLFDLSSSDSDSASEWVVFDPKDLFIHAVKLRFQDVAQFVLIIVGGEREIEVISISVSSAKDVLCELSICSVRFVGGFRRNAPYTVLVLHDHSELLFFLLRTLFSFEPSIFQ